ncbi:hypothetical protein SAMN05421798_1722 [Pseudovibrio axinellae]|nr:hypothetical protein SAMN05421798_1722 [Pseudovibrio axinellae]
MAFVTDRSTSHVAQLPIGAGAKVNLITPIHLPKIQDYILRQQLLETFDPL